MNHVFVVDASVAVKWLVYEEFTDRAQALLRDSRQVLRPLLGPPLLASEVMNAIYKKLRIEQSITDEEADQALTEFFSWPAVQLYAPPGLYQRAFSFARINNLPRAYDSQYVALAEMLQAEFWTDDRNLIRAVQDVAPWIRWIGDYPVDATTI